MSNIYNPKFINLNLTYKYVLKNTFNYLKIMRLLHNIKSYTKFVQLNHFLANFVVLVTINKVILLLLTVN